MGMESGSANESPKKLFSAQYYLCHVGIILYIVAGILIQVISYLNGGPYRVVSIATWPWVLTGSVIVYTIAVLYYVFLMVTILKAWRERVDEFRTDFWGILPYFLYFLCGFILVGRYFWLLISPA
jgi:hypothetical protein